MIILFAFISISYGQKKSSLHLGIHYFNLEDEKFALDFINIGYQKEFAKRLNWDTSLGFISYSRQDKNFIKPYADVIINDPNAYFDDFNQTSILAFNSRIGYSIIKKKKFNMGLALGITTVYAIESRFSTGNSFYNPNTNFISYTSYAEYNKAFDIGWTPKFFVERKINSSLGIEAAAEIYFHLRNEVSYIYALGLRVNYTLGSKNGNTKKREIVR
jgi:hypothetical protein